MNTSQIFKSKHSNSTDLTFMYTHNFVTMTCTDYVSDFLGLLKANVHDV